MVFSRNNDRTNNVMCILILALEKQRQEDLGRNQGIQPRPNRRHLNKKPEAVPQPSPASHTSTQMNVKDTQTPETIRER